MKKDNLIIVGIVILLVVSGGLIYKNLSGPKKKVVQEKNNAAVEAVAEMAANDKQILEEGKASDAQLATSLKRLSFSDREAILPFVEKYQKHNAPVVRAAAIEAAGALHSTDLTKFLTEKLTSTDEVVRVAALKGLMRHQGEQHHKIIEGFIANQGSKATGDESLWAYLALGKVSQNEKDRATALTKLLNDLGSDSLFSSMGTDRQEVAHQVLNVFQGEQAVAALSRNILLKAKDIDLSTHALQYLAAYDKDWLMGNIGTVPVRDSGTFQSEVVVFLGKTCPKGAKDVLGKIQAQYRKELACP